jgi:hypothetical protein
VDFGLSYGLVAGLSTVFLLLLWGLTIIISLLIPRIFFLIITSTSLHKTFSPIPSHEALIRASSTNAAPFIDTWPENTLRQVALMVKARSEGSNVQVQSFSFFAGIFGLLGVLIIFFPIELTQPLVDVYNYFLSQTFGQGPTVVNLNALRFIAAIAIGGIISVGCFYFASFYRTVRVLEIMDVVCALRLEKLRGQPSTPAAVGAPITLPSRSSSRTVLQMLPCLSFSIAVAYIIQRICMRRTRNDRR